MHLTRTGNVGIKRGEIVRVLIQLMSTAKSHNFPLRFFGYRHVLYSIFSTYLRHFILGRRQGEGKVEMLAPERCVFSATNALWPTPDLRTISSGGDLKYLESRANETDIVRGWRQISIFCISDGHRAGS